jgi:hypothetical protein
MINQSEFESWPIGHWDILALGKGATASHGKLPANYKAPLNKIVVVKGKRIIEKIQSSNVIILNLYYSLYTAKAQGKTQLQLVLLRIDVER